MLRCLPVLACAERVVPIPRWHTDELDPAEFEARYLDRGPVILTGASLCPAGISLGSVESYAGLHPLGFGDREVHIQIGR